MNNPNRQTDPVSTSLEILLRRMQSDGDFPALSESIRTINRVTEAKDKSLDQLAAAVVHDFALTQKILKIVNSAYYGRFAGKIGTITRAIVVIDVHARLGVLVDRLDEPTLVAGNPDRMKAILWPMLVGSVPTGIVWLHFRSSTTQLSSVADPRFEHGVGSHHLEESDHLCVEAVDAIGRGHESGPRPSPHRRVPLHESGRTSGRNSPIVGCS